MLGYRTRTTLHAVNAARFVADAPRRPDRATRRALDLWAVAGLLVLAGSAAVTVVVIALALIGVPRALEAIAVLGQGWL
jgi:hypothetical protein